MAIKAPTRNELIAAVKEHFNLEDFAMRPEDIDDEMYEKCIKGYEKGLNIRSMANRLRFQSVGGAQKEGATYENATGYLVGSKDIATQNNPLGKNKVQSLGMLVEGDDGKLRIFSEPNTPSGFKGFKTKNFLKHIEAELEFTSNGTGQYVTPHKVTVIDDEELDFSNVVAVDNVGLLDVEEFKAVAVVGTIGSIRESRIAAWDRDAYPDDEDYPMLDKRGNPTLTMYLHAEEGEPVVKVQFGPTHLSEPIIELEDFDVLWDPEDVEDVREEVSPAFSGRRVIVFGQRRKDSDSGDVTFIDMEGFSVFELEDDVEPIIENPESKVKKAKGKGGKAAKAEKVEKPEKKAPADKKAEMEAKQRAVRLKNVEQVVDVMQGETTVEVVRKMASGPAFKYVDDDYIQELIDEVFEAQGIEAEAEEEEAPAPKPKAKPKAKPAKKAEPEPEPEEEEEDPEEDSEEEEPEGDAEEEDEEDIF